MNSEQRMHINLSRHAYAVLISDRDSFTPGNTLGSFVNDIIEASIDDSPASISKAREEETSKYREALRISRYRIERPRDKDLSRYSPDRVFLSEEDEALINQLVSGYAEKLTKRANSRPKDVPLKIRLRKKQFDYLYSEEDLWPEHEYYQRRSDYIKALLEEYSEKNYYEREAVAFKGQLDALTFETELPFEARRILIIESISKNGTINKHEIKPYSVMPDIGVNYHYLVCLARNASDPSDAFMVASFRLSRIEKTIKPAPKSHGSGKITKAQQNGIEQALESRGVQFLIGENELFEVALTSKGLSMFGEVLHMRPTPISVRANGNDTSIMTFDCTRRQIENYFFRFGREAIIIDSPSIASSFESRYYDAATAYRNASLMNQSSFADDCL